jgi:acyl-CoA dehydrogenase
VQGVVDGFGDDYWLRKDREGGFPEEFYRAMAEGGWLGIALPEAYGGAGLGVSEAALMMMTVAGSGGAMAAASAIHMNVFGPKAIAAHGSEAQRRRWLPEIVAGRYKMCFGVTEPDAGLDTTRIATRAERAGDHYVVHGQKIWTSTAQVARKIMLLARTAPRDEAEPTAGLSLFFADLDRATASVRRIEKMGRKAVDSNEVYFDGMRIPVEDRIGEEGRGFRYILDSLNPERVLIAAEGIGIGRDALARAARYARDRVVFQRPIGQNQSIQHPLAVSWAELEAAFLMTMKAAWLYDAGRPCGLEANAAKYLAAEAGFNACKQAVTTHGGMGYAREFHVERLMREVMIPYLAPVSQQMALNFLAERALDLPKSY